MKNLFLFLSILVSQGQLLHVNTSWISEHLLWPLISQSSILITKQSVLRLCQHCLLGPQVGGEITSLSGCRNDTKRKTRLDKNRFDYSPPYDLSTAAEMNISFGWADKYHITEHKSVTPECSNDQSFRHFILHPLEQKIQQLDIVHMYWKSNFELY